MTVLGARGRGAASCCSSWCSSSGQLSPHRHAERPSRGSAQILLLNHERLAETFLEGVAQDELPHARGTVLPDGGSVNPCIEGLGARSEELQPIRELGTDITVTGVDIQGDEARVTAVFIEPRPASSLSVTLDRSGGSWRVVRLTEVPIAY